jgi:hypothetical protein
MIASRLVTRPSRSGSGLLLALAVLGLWFSRPGLPEAELFRSFVEWHQPISATVDRASLAQFERLGLLNSDVASKYQIEARAADPPKNLILVYLESVGRNLVEQEQWPDLMPSLDRLIREHSYVDFLWASSYITIEGLTNSMCGTLFPFSASSDSMASGRGLAQNLACLGDVLDEAGYYQVYLGGAGMNFAGKGDFLADHGYDELRGLEYWRQQGLDQRTGTWGLSDADLFQQSIIELRRLKEAGQPFNLTLLTIGTHLPGYFYQECAPYLRSENRFLQALHCKDQLLQGWIEQLRTEGLLEDSLLVITADHHIFPNPDMQVLFGNAVYDRRIPFVVLGGDIPAPQSTVGAAYDIAPTVLDLLRLDHNASFLLGRSLVEETSRPDYYLRRYEDVADGQAFESGSVACREDPGSEERLPLSRCKKGELITLLEALVVSQSQPAPRLICDNEVDSVLDLIGQENAVLRITIEGEDISDHFIHQERRVDAGRGGWYLLEMDGDGWLVSQRFIPLSGQGQQASISSLHARSRHWLIVGVPVQDSKVESIQMPGGQTLGLNDMMAWWAGDAGEARFSGSFAESGQRALESMFCPLLP